MGRSTKKKTTNFAPRGGHVVGVYGAIPRGAIEGGPGPKRKEKVSQKGSEKEEALGNLSKRKKEQKRWEKTLYGEKPPGAPKTKLLIRREGRKKTQIPNHRRHQGLMLLFVVD